MQMSTVCQVHHVNCAGQGVEFCLQCNMYTVDLGYFLALSCWKNSVARLIVVVMQHQGTAPAPDPHCIF